MNSLDRLSGILEAILFVSGEAVSIDQLMARLGHDRLQVEHALMAMEKSYEHQDRGIQLKRFGAYVQLTSKGDYAPFVERFLQPVQRQSLSQSALETLSIVAYRQPVTRQEVEAVRGVKCDYSLQSLSQKDLIREVGRKDALGRPILYGTTEAFLSHFGIQSLAELPKVNVPDDGIKQLSLLDEEVEEAGSDSLL